MNTFSSFIIRIHEYIRSTAKKRDGVRTQSLNTKQETSKEYRRMPHVALPVPDILSGTLTDSLRQTTLINSNSITLPLSQSKLGTLLGNAFGATGTPLRHYPSLGGLYPIETYLVGNVLEGQPRGIFHYNPNMHALEFLWEIPANFQMSNVINIANLPSTSIFIAFTSLWDRSSKIHGDLSYSEAHIEVGHLSQNIMLVATSLGIRAQTISDFDDSVLSELLDIDTHLEQPIHSILLGS